MDIKYINHFINGLTSQERRAIAGHDVTFTSTHHWQKYVDMGIYTRDKYNEDRWIFHSTELGYAVHHKLNQSRQGQ